MGRSGINAGTAVLEVDSPTSRNNGLPSALPGADFDRLAAGLEGAVDSLAASVLARARDRGLSGPREPDLRARLGDFLRASLAAQLRSFRLGALPERCPEADAEAFAALAAVTELELLLNGYRLCQMTLWEAWFAHVEDSRLAAAARRRLLGCGSDFFFRYADLLSGYAVEAYRRQAQAPPAGGEDRRLRAIEGLLGGDPLAASGLDLDLERHHLGLIAWGEDPAAAARRLAGTLGRPIFALASPEGARSCWAWISGTRPLGAPEQRVLGAFQPEGAQVALGLEGFGEEGFRASHRQARRAQRFAAAPGPSLTRYEDVVIEALAAENEEDARAFVAHELRGIDDDTPPCRRIRETLAAYFAAECNAACAAAALGIHQQTVANRLRSAEQRLGRDSIGGRRVELELALRLRTSLAV